MRYLFRKKPITLSLSIFLQAEKGIPTIAGKSKSESKDKERKHKKHKDRDKDKDKEHKKHKHRHKDRSKDKDKDKKKDKSGHHDSGADHAKKHHEKVGKHSLQLSFFPWAAFFDKRRNLVSSLAEPLLSAYTW